VTAPKATPIAVDPAVRITGSSTARLNARDAIQGEAQNEQWCSAE
jgi:hypothetical protein